MHFNGIFVIFSRLLKQILDEGDGLKRRLGKPLVPLEGLGIPMLGVEGKSKKQQNLWEGKTNI